ncbi:2-C-methyl-D-erythritol 4-phosphate cytidylyltransferase [Clostridium lundense]|uniref:2-C-methyl-D-erythritol 4-phosphate cytidylyltransferase n=1 Tax=Clostridium lundense TaxID=319475 RepID=UPI00048823DB|nr:2-C-methyl-D-erythritol 4-phosphate cytidylyltransferase [Clostridium lundense]
MKKNCALILAAGKGARMGAGINKQFLNIKGKPILVYTLQAFNIHPEIESIVLVAAEGEAEYCRKEIVEKYNISKVESIVIGGKERQESVLSGLNKVKNADIVLIHDGARPFVSNRIISEGIKYAKLYGACSCGVRPKDTIKIINGEGFSIDNLDRDTLANVQTPQCFKYDLIYKCHKEIMKKKVKVTDDTSVVEYFGYKVYIYDGDYKNIKITTPEDMIIGESIMKELH